MISVGISKIGVPSGRRWAKAWDGWFRMPIITVAIHRGTASPRFSESCVVGVKVYGSRPNVLRDIRNTIKEANSKAHLWAPLFKGAKSCCVNWPINCAWRAETRFFSHPAVGVGYKTQGSVKAIMFNGIPKKTGLINWSKNPNAMVSFMNLLLIFGYL